MSTESALGEEEKVLEKAGVDGCIAVWMFLIIIIKEWMVKERLEANQSCLPFLCILQVTFFHFMFFFGCEREWIMNQNSIFFHHILCVIWLQLYPFIIKISPNSGVGSPATHPGDCTQFSVSIITAFLLTAIANGDHKYNSFFFLEYVWKGWYC